MIEEKKEIINEILELTSESKSVFAYLREPYKNAEEIIRDGIKENGMVSEDDVYKAAHNLLIRRYVKKIKNYENILSKAEKQFDMVLKMAARDDIKLQAPDDDWLEYFFDLSSRVSNEAVQNIWARILLQEHIENGYVKKIMLNTLALLDAESARCFQNICSLTYQMIIDDDIRSIPFVIYDYNIEALLNGYEGDSENFEKYLSICPDEDQLDYLAELGLITTTNLTESVYCIYFTEESNVTFSCFDGGYTIVSPYKNESNVYQVEASFVFFTQVGYSLYKILNVTPFEGLFEVLKRFAENQIS